MAEHASLTKLQLLDCLQAGWVELNRFANRLSVQQLTVLADAGGWTVQDHLIHLAIWESSVIALLDGSPRYPAMGVEKPLWTRADWDGINAVVQRRYHDLPSESVRYLRADIHQRLLNKIHALTEADLQRSYADYQPGSTYQVPVIVAVAESSYLHYDQHRPWMEAILHRDPAESAEALGKTELLNRMRIGWDELNRYVATLGEAQLTVPTDAAGWTAKDHLAHLAFWEDSICALLNGLTQSQFTGTESWTWETAHADIDRVNAVVQRRFHDLSLDALKRMHDHVHQGLMRRLESMSEQDLHRPYTDFQPDMTWHDEVIGWIAGNSYEHYAEHRPWIEAIVAPVS